jgi:hypothetical protein
VSHGPVFTLKPIAPESIARALEKAERYRLLNEPAFAESICLDVLAIEPENQQALVSYLLSLTDQFTEGLEGAEANARAVLPRLHGEYERIYYAGIICERRAKALLAHGGYDSGSVAYEYLRDALEYFEKAQAVQPPGNDDAILRYNTCVRMMEWHHLEPGADERQDYPLE